MARACRACRRGRRRPSPCRGPGDSACSAPQPNAASSRRSSTPRPAAASSKTPAKPSPAAARAPSRRRAPSSRGALTRAVRRARRRSVAARGRAGLDSSACGYARRPRGRVARTARSSAPPSPRPGATTTAFQPTRPGNVVVADRDARRASRPAPTASARRASCAGRPGRSGSEIRPPGASAARTRPAVDRQRARRARPRARLRARTCAGGRPRSWKVGISAWSRM